MTTILAPETEQEADIYTLLPYYTPSVLRAAGTKPTFTIDPNDPNSVLVTETVNIAQ